MRRGLTLIELLVALAMSVFVIAGSAAGYVEAVKFDNSSRQAQETYESRARLQERLTGLLREAYVSPSANDPMTYFNGDATGTSAQVTAADSVTFTTLGEGINGTALTSTDDFETLNSRFGAQGGVAEISLSTTPIGEGGQSKQGLFLREQRPADGDPTQGGNESVLDPDVTSIQFEFFNGSDWDPTWSTSGQTTDTQSQNAGIDGRRIPSAVRVTYTLSSDADGMQHAFIVRLDHSDVTPTNPIVVGGTQ